MQYQDANISSDICISIGIVINPRISTSTRLSIRIDISIALSTCSCTSLLTLRVLPNPLLDRDMSNAPTDQTSGAILVAGI